MWPLCQAMDRRSYPQEGPSGAVSRLGKEEVAQDSSNGKPTDRRPHLKS